MSQRATRAKKLGATLLVSTVAASLSPLFAGMASAAPPPAPSIAAVCANADNVHPFTDLGSASGEALQAINCLVDLGIVNGTTPTTFSPTVSLTRQQGAALIVRIADAKNANDAPGGVTLTDVPLTGPDQFTDDEGSTLEDSINRLAGVDIILGKTATIFDPTAPLTRGQFASLIDRMETYLVTGSTTGTSPWATTTDFFNDDTGSVHEAAINRVASRGILVGDGNVTSGVNDPISRTQAALVVARVLAVNLADGLITVPPRAVTPNQTLAVSPTTAATNTVSDPDPPNTNRGARTFTVNGLTNGTTFDIQLVLCEEVTNTNGVISFADVTGNANEADFTASNAMIEVVNGAVVVPSDHVEVAPVNGTISFTIDSETQNECVIPVIFIDGDNDDALELNANNQPTQAFGIGGSKTFNPEAAPAGALVTDQNIFSVNKDTNQIVTDDFTFLFDANDLFFVDADNSGTCEAGEQVTLAGFEAQLSSGDQLGGQTVNQPTPELSSTFCLLDLSPSAPTVTVDDVTATAIEITVTDVLPGATVQVFIDDDSTTDDDGSLFPAGFTLVVSAASDEDPNTAGIQFTIPVTGANNSAGGQPASGCGAGTRDFTVAATQTIDGEVSDPDFAIDNCVPDIAETTAPTITDARVTTDTVVLGILESGDVFTLLFSEDMIDTLGDGTTFVRLTDANTTSQVTCGGGATCVLDDGATPTVADDRLVVTLTANPTFISGVDDGLDFAGGTVTITLVSNNFDDQAGNQLNLAGSADKVIDVEGP
ncbi:MAG: S-layer homology domain-containing protein [Acidimicrobiia bacterium]|nr:S-layer homology domain-containing protein [Acidimicrobiia bacterium]